MLEGLNMVAFALVARGTAANGAAAFARLRARQVDPEAHARDT
jgi:hypothetical protein